MLFLANAEAWKDRKQKLSDYGYIEDNPCSYPCLEAYLDHYTGSSGREYITPYFVYPNNPGLLQMVKYIYAQDLTAVKGLLNVETV